MARDLAEEQRWRYRIEECSQSELSIRAWCIQNGLKKTAYHYWARKFKLQEQLEAESNPFAEVLLPTERGDRTKESGSPKPELSLSLGDYCIGIPDGFNPVTLEELVKVPRKL
ncbi:hypothetical protein REC12_25675 [Desulfosporosinus sp. PR]|uniref:IS66 family insertion sequence element accessory protein TnpA n=1 Tax=Candidatus Desulfosporosinus nitrosoreducens TaxID=3401928 RepID=UPI0027EF2336|nr:hypothetical protein [Desulfosporosinus sp. PR]MDQ7096989.1 hypothetical protein [Desulfosporosinus sp. PR]